MESTREILYSNSQNGEQKTISNFFPLKTMAPDTKIEGLHKGRFESKKKQGYFFHLFENEAGEVNAYGTCKVLDERVNEFKSKCEELNVNPAEVMMSTTFYGRLKNKNNDRTSYKFSNVVIFKSASNGKKNVGAGTVANSNQASNTQITNTDVPF